MFRSSVLRGVSAGALTVACLGTEAPAQEALPQIEVGVSGPIQRDAPFAPAAAGTSSANSFDNPNYSVPDAMAATKTDTPIFVTPASIEVVPRAVIDDRKENSLSEVLQNVSGVQFEPTLGGYNIFNIRGFRTTSVYRNALPVGPTGFVFSNSIFDTANFESVEVLKGPAAMLYGRGDPGGLIDMVTKKPLDTPHYSLEQQIGSSSHYRTVIDATGPLNQDRTLLYRFTGAFQSENSTTRDFMSSDRYNLAGAVTWRPSPLTEITYDVELAKQRFKPDSGVIAFGNRPISVPISRSFQDPNEPYANLLTLYNGVNIKQTIYDGWTLNGRFLARNRKSDDTEVIPALSFVYSGFHGLGAFDPATGILHRNIYEQQYYERSWAGNIDLTGKFETFGVKHDVLIGGDYNKVTSDYKLNGDYLFSDPALDINVYAPWYGIPAGRFSPPAMNFSLAPSITDGGNYPVSRLKQQNTGIYVQDHVTVLDRVHIIGGGRWDYAVHGYGFTDYYGGIPLFLSQVNVPKFGEHGFSPRVGVLFEATPWLSIFGDWSRSFGVNNGVTSSRQPLPPEISQQWEAGLKGRFFDDRLATTLAFYQITKQNIASTDLSTLNSSIAGVVRSRGVELDVSGRVNDNLSLIANYAHTHTKILSLSQFNFDLEQYVSVAGNWWPNVPRNSGSIWAKYDWNGYLVKEGLSFGLGVRYVDIRQGDTLNSFQLPAYAVLDALIGYRWKYQGADWNAQVNFKNLTDTKYYQSADQFSNLNPRLGIYPGERFQVIGSLKVGY